MKNKALLQLILVSLAIFIIGGVVLLIQKGNFNDQSRASLGNVLVGKLVRSSDKVCTKCVEQCPGKDNILRSCNPMESDGTSLDSSCNQAGRVESCGNQTFCCPKAGGKWTTDINQCKSVAKIKQNDTSSAKKIQANVPNLMPTVIPSNYRILRDGGTCTALVVSKSMAEPLVGKNVIATGSLKEPYFFASNLSESKCVEQCPGKDNVMRSCTPPEADGTSEDSTCTQGRIASCGGTKFCCSNQVWSKDLSKCISVTMTPKPTATPTPITPTPTSSISATPAMNLPPYFITTELPTAFTGQQYSASIEAGDKTNTDTLSMSIGHLPAGFVQGPCAVPISGGRITCYISGMSKTPGAYQIIATVKDQIGASTTKYFTLSIK